MFMRTLSAALFMGISSTENLFARSDRLYSFKREKNDKFTRRSDNSPKMLYNLSKSQTSKELVRSEAGR
jgi:hypothetical protein